MRILYTTNRTRSSLFHPTTHSCWKRCIRVRGIFFRKCRSIRANNPTSVLVSTERALLKSSSFRNHLVPNYENSGNAKLDKLVKELPSYQLALNSGRSPGSISRTFVLLCKSGQKTSFSVMVPIISAWKLQRRGESRPRTSHEIPASLSS